MENSPSNKQKSSKMNMVIKPEASEFEGNTLDEAINKAVSKIPAFLRISWTSK